MILIQTVLVMGILTIAQLSANPHAQPRAPLCAWVCPCAAAHHVYPSVAAMTADASQLKTGMHAETLSYLANGLATGIGFGARVYRIQATAPVPADGGRVIDLGNGLFAVARFADFVSPFDYGASGDPAQEADAAVVASFSAAMALGLPWDVSNGSFRYHTDLVVPAWTNTRRIQGSGRSVEASSTTMPSHSLIYEGAGSALTLGEDYQAGAGAPLFGFLVRDVNLLCQAPCQAMLSVKYAPSLQVRGMLTGGTGPGRPAAGIVLNDGAYSGQYESVQVVNVDGPGWRIGEVNNTSLVMCGASTVFNGYEIDLDNGKNLNFFSCQMTNAKDVSGDGLTGNGYLLRSGINMNIIGAYTDSAGNQHADIYCLGDRGVVGGVTVTGNTVGYGAASIKIALVSGFTMVGGFLRSIEMSGPAAFTKDVLMANVDRDSFAASVVDPGNVITWIDDDLQCRSVVVQGGNSQAAGLVLRSGAQDAGMYSGNGSPEGIVVADTGSLYLRQDGGTGSTLYVKESGSGSSAGWAAK